MVPCDDFTVHKLKGIIIHVFKTAWFHNFITFDNDHSCCLDVYDKNNYYLYTRSGDIDFSIDKLCKGYKNLLSYFV